MIANVAGTGAIILLSASVVLWVAKHVHYQMHEQDPGTQVLIAVENSRNRR